MEAAEIMDSIEKRAYILDLSLQRAKIPMVPRVFFHCNEGFLTIVSGCCFLGF